MTDWTLECPKPTVWDKLTENERDAWLICIESLAKLEKLPINEVATRNCGWKWHPIDREIANG